MHAEVVRHLRCPVCRGPLAAPVEVRGALRCPSGHSFDQARGGYLHLAAGQLSHPGDTAEMVAARTAFLGAGHYDFISTALATVAADVFTELTDVADVPGGGRLVLDVGAGTGRHPARVLDALPGIRGLAIDTSRAAIRVAARAHPRLDAVIADGWQPLPVGDGAVGVLLNVFAPRSGPEFARVLCPDGRLLTVTPTGEHLTELVAALDLLRVDPAKDGRVADRLGTSFVAVGRDVYRHRMALTHAEVATLVGMGPSARHTDPDALAGRIAALPDPVRVTAAVTLTVYRKP